MTDERVARLDNAREGLIAGMDRLAAHALSWESEAGPPSPGWQGRYRDLKDEVGDALLGYDLAAEAFSDDRPLSLQASPAPVGASSVTASTDSRS